MSFSRLLQYCRQRISAIVLRSMQILTQLRKLDALTEEEKEFLTARRNSVEPCKADWRNGSKQLARKQCASRGCRAYNRFPTPAYLTSAIGLRAEVHWSTAMTANPAVREQRVTPDHIRSKKGRERITFVTAYDFPTAKLADEAGFDMVLVGDTLAEVVLGHETTLPVSFETMLHHTSAARRAIKRALLVADLPYGTYHASEEDAVRFGVRFVKEGGAQAVKLEGGRKRLDVIRRMLDAEIPMMGHIGLTPQSLHRMGGYKVQGRLGADIETLLLDAIALDKAGVFAMVLEGIPREVAKTISAEVSAPTLGIGAGPDCDGQVLVLNDLLGLTFKRPAKFVRQYFNGESEIGSALARFKADVESGDYPADAESYHLSADLQSHLPEILKRISNSE